MLFSSLLFLSCFLPVVLLAHLLLPKKLRNPFLLMASIVFYAWGEIRYVPLVLFSMALNYLLGRCAATGTQGKKRVFLILSLCFNLGALCYFKYADFLMQTLGLSAYAPHVALPLGISFYTFQTQAYVIDVYRGKVPPEQRFIDYATFILLFPQLIAGPIVLYTDISTELKKRQVDAASLEAGMGAFITGLAMKVLLANPLGGLWETLQGPAYPNAPAAWLGILAFGLQIYYDFAGYSLMAIGMGRMLGFRFPQNFNLPYAARSIRDFWRRWHMTLGGWFREYLYIPLGGSRKGTARTILNLFIVWFLTGLWHGAGWNFVLWGLWFFVFLVLERYAIGGFLERHRIFSHAYALLVVLLGWVLFAFEDLSEGMAYLGRMLTFTPEKTFLFPLQGHAILLSIAVLCCVPPVIRTGQRLLARYAPLRVSALLLTLLLCIAGLVNADYNPFLYFRF